MDPNLWTACCAGSVVLLLVATWRGSAAWAAAAKTAAALSFVAVGLSRATPSPIDVTLCAGLSLSAVGDLLLLSKRRFLAGLVAFLLAHLLYLGAFSLRLDPSAWPVWPAVPIAVASLVVLSALWRHLGSMRGPVIAYVAVISAMLWGAAAVVLAAAAPARLLCGAALFYVSDVFVARQRFVGEWIGNRLLGLPAYFAGQLLLAWSVGW